MSWLRLEPGPDPRGEERRLVARLLARDEAAFEAFSSHYTPPLYRYAQRALGDRETTREVVQSTLCKAIAQLRAFRGESGLTTWLVAICRNEIAAHFRRGGRSGREVGLPDEGGGAGTSGDPVLVEGSPGPEQALLGRERVLLVHQALDLLPPHYGQALEWKYLEHLPVDEIARRLELRPKAAESTLTRAREAFRRVFAGLLARGFAGGRRTGSSTAGNRGAERGGEGGS